MCCATAGCAGCSPESGHPPRWVRSCARSPLATSASSTPSPHGSLINLAKNAPILPGADQGAYVDIDDTIKATHGYAKQGAGYGYTGVKGLNALLAIVSTPTSAPVVAATRLRRGGTNSARGAARIVADALVTTKACGGRGLVTVRADSAYYGHDVIAAARRGGARFSITVRMNRTVVKAISGIPESAWTPIHYPNAIWDEDEQRLVSDAKSPKCPSPRSPPAPKPTTSAPG